MNKKLIYILVIFVAGLFVVSACERAAGRPPSQRDQNRWVTATISVNPPEFGEIIYYNNEGRISGDKANIRFPINNSGYTFLHSAVTIERNHRFSNWSGDIQDIPSFNASYLYARIPMDRNRYLIANII